jgi:calcineurin-like phosphoesterase family protein
MSYVRKFFISDTHFNHTNILSMQPRPFSTIEQHDEAIITRWNAVVAPADVVWHLGDFALGLNNPDRIRWIFSRLNGRKHLVYGNHDVRRDGALHPAIAGLEWSARPEAIAFVKDEGHQIVLSHYAQRCWQGRGKGSWHFYGHAHGRLPAEGRSRDVGVDLPDVDFTPRTFKQLTKGMTDV